MAGNQTSKVEKTFNTNDSKKLNHVCFGPVEIFWVKNKDGEQQQFMSLTRPVENKAIFDNWVKDIQQIEDSQTRQVLLLPTNYKFQKQGMCGSSGLVESTYQSYMYALSTEIQNRKSLNRYFLQTQIWYLLYNMIRAANKFERLKRKIGDVRPQNILINDDGQVKILSTCTIIGQQTNFQKIIDDQKNITFLAPQELRGIDKFHYPANIDACKAQVFSIGLTILASGTLDDCKQAYSQWNKTIRLQETKLNQYLSIFSQKYSSALVNVVNSMVLVNETQRRKASQIYELLSPHQMAILELEQFALNMGPSTLTSHHPSNYSHDSRLPKHTPYAYNQPPYQPYYQQPQQISSNVVNRYNQQDPPRY